MHNENSLYQIALTKINQVGPATARMLMRLFDTPEQLFSEHPSKRKKISRIRPAVWKAMEDPKVLKDAESELSFVIKNNLQLHFFKNANYPWRLNMQEDSPVLLYSKGNFQINPERSLAIVGTRRISEYGHQLVDFLLQRLRTENVQIISGLAYGVDTAAHKVCVQLGIETLGILGHGLDRVYPHSNRSLASRMMDHGGLLTEFGQGILPDRENFPMRNRIIAGLCDALVVIETAESGGSMISAEIANGYNREVFVFPGSVFSEYSRGCHKLIRQLKAQLLSHPDDLIRELQWNNKEKRINPMQTELFDTLMEDEKKIVDWLALRESAHVDALHLELGLGPSLLAGTLLNLEMKGIIRTLPGKKYTLTH